ncbi:PapD-like protein [Jimgerdemannia flammicorona]|uniref:PapD-like protein n=1 Tax=Jimgerdemannia flammicorona TaxID=994334 RepID=A0A433Q2V0_9FUNG|nr:PapD-like protein [Jimgerdemannia flammicorona]
MSVDLEPATQLAFRRPLTVLVKEILRVKNPHPQPVAFKVKTTAPKQYCVRPNSGRIEPHSEVEVQDHDFVATTTEACVSTCSGKPHSTASPPISAVTTTPRFAGFSTTLALHLSPIRGP